MEDEEKDAVVIQEFVAPSDNLSFIQTNAATYHLDPPFTLVPGRAYRVEITTKQVKMWKLEAYQNIKPDVMH